MTDGVRNKGGMIQFWNYGALANKVVPEMKPKLEFCLLHNFGEVSFLEWCPSGCNDEGDKEFSDRLGVLAVCSDDGVYVYAIPIPGIVR